MCHSIIEPNMAHYSFVLTLECNQFALMLPPVIFPVSPSPSPALTNNSCKNPRERTHRPREKTYLSNTVCYSNPAVSYSVQYKDA